MQIFVFLLAAICAKSYQLNRDTQVSVEGCMSTQVNAVYSSIASCETEDYNRTAICIKLALLDKVHQNWNVFSTKSRKQAGISYWLNNQCEVALNNYGKFKRSYSIWPVRSTTNSHGNSPHQALNSSGRHSNLKECTQERKETVKNSIASCQVTDHTEAANCIQNQLFTVRRQFWNVYVVDPSAQATVEYWSQGVCTLFYTQYGRLKRNFIIWI